MCERFSDVPPGGKERCDSCSRCGPLHCRDEHDKHCALWSVDELTRLCMERATSARQCVQLMGAAAEERGFYGSDGFEGSGTLAYAM